ncbi:hypothetical protein ATN00_02455 [Sphingobium baderi]|uniref:EthD domain-containing protein n=2 Tax=Sphingobium baderi TaxID=1332080 RepID=A0A0S3EV87_9SPHN|nr:hypothetical protein ATN00_02455 [Sphingobium baderi]
MAKLMTLIKRSPDVSAEQFRSYWRDIFLPQLRALPLCADSLSRAVHHHVVPKDVRSGEGFTPQDWAGVGCYYFDNHDDPQTLLSTPAFQDLFADTSHIAKATHLLVDEIWMYNRDKSHLPLKMFSFFKRLPRFTRAFAHEYYLTLHADVGASINKNRTVRYIQNHVLQTYRNPDAEYDFDAGPEIWFKSMEIADDLFADAEGMAILSADEERFCDRPYNIFFMTDEQQVFSRDN